jgi:hypothetical protein
MSNGLVSKDFGNFNYPESRDNFSRLRWTDSNNQLINMEIIEEI